MLQRDVAECITDLENTFDSTEVDLSDPEQIFQSLHASTVEQECFFPFLSVLQTLLLIPSYDVFGKKQWSLVDTCIKKIVRGTMFEEESGGTSGSLLMDSKESLGWKQRVEELSQQVEMLGKHCQTLEEEETLLKDELQELRSREASLQFLREGDSTRHSHEVDLRRRHEAEILRQAEEIVRKFSAGKDGGVDNGEGCAIGAGGGCFDYGQQVISAGHDIGSKMAKGLVSRQEIEAHAAELEKQLHEIQTLLRTDIERPPVPTRSFSHQNEIESPAAPTVKQAVNSRRLIPRAPVLPTVFNLSHQPLSVQGGYNIQCAPPLPGADTMDVLSRKPKKKVIAPKVPMRSLFWTRVPDISIHKTIWEQLSDDNISLNVAKLEQQFCKTINNAGADGEEELKELKIEKKEKLKDIALLDSKGSIAF